jgi:hypothetical protein
MYLQGDCHRRRVNRPDVHPHSFLGSCKLVSTTRVTVLTKTCNHTYRPKDLEANEKDLYNPPVRT